ncbi:MAG: CapA family protein [Myxococcota bacterium]
MQRIFVFTLLFAAACATTTEVRAPVAVPSPGPAPAQPTAAVPAPPPIMVSDNARAQAHVLVEQGRNIVVAKGDEGAAEALAFYREAYALDGTSVESLWEMGWAYQTLRQWDDALAVWREVEKLAPDHPELQKFLPLLVMRRDQAAVLAALPEPDALIPPEEEPRPGPIVTLAAVGDVQLGRGWPAARATLPTDAKSLFVHVKPVLEAADIAFGNLETVLADEGESSKCGPRSTRCYAFRVPTAFAAALADTGFDVMSIANNHAGDFGPAGRKSTQSALDACAIRHSGPIGDIASWEHNGVRMALVAFSTGDDVYRVQELAIARKVIAGLDRTHDLVIVSYHGGAEGTGAAHVPQGTEKFLGEDRGDLRTFTHLAIDAGADVVIGHGPHLWRAMEIYKGRLIAYSLGNFSSFHTFNLTSTLGLTGILRLSLAPNGVLLAAEVVPLRLEEPGIPTPDPKGKVIEHVRKLSREDFGVELLDDHGRYRRAGSQALSQRPSTSTTLK